MRKLAAGLAVASLSVAGTPGIAAAAGSQQCVRPVQNGRYPLPSPCGQNYVDIRWVGGIETVVAVGTDYRIYESDTAGGVTTPWRGLDAGTVSPAGPGITFTATATSGGLVEDGYLRVTATDGRPSCKAGHEGRWITPWYGC